MKARVNPFRAERIDALPFRQPGFEWEAFLNRIGAAGFRGAIVGPHGHGKTTLVEELIPRLQRLGERPRRLRLNEEHRRKAGEIVESWVRGSDRDELLLLDGAEQLGPIAWRRFLQGTSGHRGVIVTIHRPGRLPTLWECRTSAEMLCDLVQELAGPDAVGREELEALYRRHRGNIRDCLRELYDRYRSPP